MGDTFAVISIANIAWPAGTDPHPSAVITLQSANTTDCIGISCYVWPLCVESLTACK